jgi:hypothetical protein
MDLQYYISNLTAMEFPSLGKSSPPPTSFAAIAGLQKKYNNQQSINTNRKKIKEFELSNCRHLVGLEE